MLKEAAEESAPLHRCADTASERGKPGFCILQLARNMRLKLFYAEIEMDVAVAFQCVCAVICGKSNLSLSGSGEANELFFKQRSGYGNVLQAGELGSIRNDDRLRRPRPNLVRIHQC